MIHTDDRDCRFDAGNAEIARGLILYRWYLAACGGGLIGSEWIDSIEDLPVTHRKVREAQRRGFYRIAHFFPLGWDGAGNPYGYDLDTGRIVTEDHDFGGIHELAPDFFGLLCAKGLVRLDRRQTRCSEPGDDALVDN